MADKKISQLTAASTPLAGTEVLPIVQSGATVKVAVSDLTAGRTVSANIVSLPYSSGNANYFYQFTGPFYGKITPFSGSGTSIYNCVYGGNGAAHIFQIESVEALRVNSSGDTVPVNNIVQGTAGKGINFTANTPAAGKTSQLLNWYEEGTWTPVATRATPPTLTYSLQEGKYTRMGRIVVAELTLIINTVTDAGAGATTITGLPFTNNGTTYSGQGMIGYNDALSATVYGCRILDTTVYFRDGTKSSSNVATAWVAGGVLAMTLVYIT